MFGLCHDHRFTHGTRCSEAACPPVGLMSEMPSKAIDASFLEQLLQAGVDDQVFPGAVACVADARNPGGWALAAAGRLQPDGPPARPDTVYDVASLTKPVVAFAALRLVAAGVFSLDAPVALWIPEWRERVIGQASLRQLLSHRSGLPAWAPLFKAKPAELGAEATLSWYLSAIAELSQLTEVPTLDETETVYSDLGYIAVGAIVARATECPLALAVRQHALAPLGLGEQMLFPSTLTDEEQQQLRVRSAATEYCPWRGRTMVGEVHDENCGALGGVAGHAGLFATADAVAHFAAAVLNDAGSGAAARFLSSELWGEAMPPDTPGRYGLGWDQGARRRPGGAKSAAGSLMGLRTFGHLGFTGTSVFCDPDTQKAVVLLSNRVNPTRQNIAIRRFRPWFHDEIASCFA